MDGTPAWGIKPVPERLRVLGLLDTGLLWGNLGVSLLVLVAGTYLVPALSLREAFLAILLGSLIGNTMLGLAALIGADGRVPAMVLMRAPLGQRGSWAPTVLNAAQCIGWSIFELLIIATAVAALSDELLGFRAQWLWTLVFGGIALALALLGPDRLRPQVRAQGRGLGGARLAPLPDVVGARRLRLRRPLGPRRRGRLVGARGRRPRRRDHGLLDPARRRLHPLQPLSRAPRSGARAPATSWRASGSGGSARPLLLARRHRSGRAAGRGRGRGHRRRPRAARGHGGRDGRGVRERLLDGRLDPEPGAARCRSARCSSSSRPSRRSAR